MNIWVPALVFSAALASAAGTGAAEMVPELKAERSKLLAGSKVKVGAILRLAAPEAPEGARTASVSMVLVIDRSGSMSDEGKMEMVHIAGPDLVDRMESSDGIGIVTFDSVVERIRPLTGVTDADGIKALIARLSPRDCTNLGGGLREGLDMFEKEKRDGSVRRLLLLSDGLANVGETDVNTLAGWARDGFLKGTRVSCVGLGRDYDENYLTKIAHAGGGEFYYISKKEQLPELFRKELAEGRAVVVSDLTAVARVSDGVEFLEAAGYPFTRGDAKAREVRIGDLFSKETRRMLLLFRIEAPGEAGIRRFRAADVELTWKDALGLPRRAVLPLDFELTFVESEAASSFDPDVRARVIETENYRALDRAMDHFRKDEKDKAAEVLKEAEAAASKAAADTGDGKLLAQAGQLAQALREVEGIVDARDAQIFNSEQGAFGQRRGSGRMTMLLRAGGTEKTECYVDVAGDWLCRRREEAGSWDPAKEGGRVEERQDATALALLGYLGAGHTEKGGRHRETVQLAVFWLMSRQEEDGRIGDEAGAPGDALARFRARYRHAMATVALCEAAGMGRVPHTVEAAQKAVTWLCSQHPLKGLEKDLEGAAGRTPEDAAGVGWCVMAIKSAKIAGLKVPEEAFMEAGDFLERRKLAVASGAPALRFNFFGADRTSAPLLDTACGILCRQFLGTGREECAPTIEWMLLQPGGMPEWGDSFDWYYTYFANLASFNVGMETWQKWNAHLKNIMAANRSADGSWDPVGNMKGRGRIFSTAMARLYLEVYYRYLPIYR
ncbi:MAG: VWA domain-containing protein [Planctomycetota bacterium]|nr:VWA domain-containing protein [Planctomycetota bacterium]